MTYRSVANGHRPRGVEETTHELLGNAIVEVYVIKHLDTNNVVAVIEAQPDVSDEQALIHWLASCGLTEKAASQFRCVYSPVIPWASLAKMFEPIAD